MENTYLFIIWNKALWCKDKIIKDLEKSFSILHIKNIKWTKSLFPDNLKALYGRKLGNPKDKILPCGNGEFCLIVIKDMHPSYDNRELFDEQGIVNTNLYDKKILYRKWTAGSHRIHCSDTIEETKHDLVVLFGNDYDSIISSKDSVISLDTKSVVGFNSIEDLLDCLKLFGNNISIIKDDNIYIFCKSRIDVSFFINPRKNSSNKQLLSLDNKLFNLYIFGENDGDIPKGFIEEASKDNELTSTIINNIDSYRDYIVNKNNDLFSKLFSKSNLDVNFVQTNDATNRKISIKQKILSEIKLLYLKITNM